MGVRWWPFYHCLNGGKPTWNPHEIIPSDKRTWQWKIHILCRKYIFQWSISHCYVSLLSVLKTKKNDWRILAWRKILDQALLHCLTPPTGYIILCWNTLLKSWTHGRQILPATSSHLINKNITSLLLPRKITWVAETNRQLINYKPSRFCFGRSRNPSSPKVTKIQPSCESKNVIES